MKKVILLKGLPGSGKSKWAKEQCDANTVRVNKDDLRAMMGGEFSKGKESIVLAIRDGLVCEALAQGKTVIVDDTNFAPIHEERLRGLASLHGAEFEVKFFDTPVDECIKRDAKRAEPVGRAVIMDMYRKYLNPLPASVETIPGLPSAIIVDIDGTLAHMNGRTPYDYSGAVLTDLPDFTIIDMVRIYSEKVNKVILVSGRKDECRQDTAEWLKGHGVIYHYLYMRKTGDDRKDYDVKKEIYEDHIKGKYNVLFVLDDRDQVVRMWREQGLKVLQVAEGNF